MLQDTQSQTKVHKFIVNNSKYGMRLKWGPTRILFISCIHTPKGNLHCVTITQMQRMFKMEQQEQFHGVRYSSFRDWQPPQNN